MTEKIQLGEIAIAVSRKGIKNVHLTVHPPDGRVTLAAPLNTRLEVARAYAATKLGWIREQREKLDALGKSGEVDQTILNKVIKAAYGLDV